MSHTLNVDASNPLRLNQDERTHDRLAAEQGDPSGLDLRSLPQRSGFIRGLLDLAQAMVDPQKANEMSKEIINNMGRE